MTDAELQCEKLSMQKELLNLQSVVGRPSNKGDKDLVRPLYDRYRELKRAIVRNSSVSDFTYYFSIFVNTHFFFRKT